MIRVAVVASFGSPCGIGDVARRLAQVLPAGFRATLVDLPTEDRPVEWRRVVRQIRDHDIVHIHYEYSLFHVVKPLRDRFSKLLRQIEAPTVVTLHESLPGLEPRWPHWDGIGDGVRDFGYLPFFCWWESAHYRRADHWIAHARPVAEKAAGFVDPRRLTLLSLPVPSVSRSWRLPSSGKPVVVSPGFVKPHKGYELMVEVLERLPGWRWVVAGGPQDDRDQRYVVELKRIVDEAGLESRVRFTGYRTEADVESELVLATIAVLPFHQAAASSSLAWAIACATPVVAADLSTFSELHADGAGIELVAGRDAGRWADRLVGLAADHHRLGELSAASHRYAATRSDSAIAAAHAAIYAGLARSTAR